MTVSAPSRKKSGKAKRAVDLFIVGVDGAKGLIYSRLMPVDPGPGAYHFPAGAPWCNEEYFEQLTAEKCVNTYRHGRRKRVWKAKRRRNEVLDNKVYSLAALYLLNPAWSVLAAKAEKKREAVEDDTGAVQVDKGKPETTRAKPKKRRRVVVKKGGNPSRGRGRF